MNSIRFFVSSTFEDMHAERDAIQLRVLPMLSRYAAEHGHGMDFRDLRWGINTQDEKKEDKSGKVIKVCFEEIKRCRPYMVVLLGERYGSIPDSTALPRILKEMNNRADRTFTEEEVAGKSYTELEILYGPLSDDETLSRTLFLFREPMEGAPSRFLADGEEGASRMADLKGRIRGLLAEKGLGDGHIMTYSMPWESENDRVAPDAVLGFAKRLEERLKEMIAPRFADWDRLTPCERLCRRQMAFAGEKAERFSAGELLILCQRALDRRVKKLYITGAEGSGKTTLAAKLVLTLQEKGHPVAAAFDRVTVDTKDHENPFEAICRHYGDFTEALLRERGYAPTVKEERPYDRLKKLLSLYDSHPDLPKLYFMTELSTALFQRDGVWNSDPFGGDYANVVFLYTLEKGDCEDYKDTAYVNADRPRPAGDILKALLSSINKELPGDVLYEIVTRYGYKSPRYYAMLVKRLMMIDGQDLAYAEKNAKLQSASGDDKLLYLEMNLVKRLPDYEEGLFAELWDEAKSTLGRELLNAIGGFLSLFRDGLTRGQLIALTERMGIAWDEVSYSTLINYFDEMITEDDRGRVIFATRLAAEMISYGMDLTPYYRVALDYLKSEKALLDTREGCRQYLKAARELSDGQAVIDAVRSRYGNSRIPLAQEVLRNNPDFVISCYSDPSLTLEKADLDFFVYRLWNLQKAAQFNRSGADRLFSLAVTLAERYGDKVYYGWAFYHKTVWSGTDRSLENMEKATELLVGAKCLGEDLPVYAELLLNTSLVACHERKWEVVHRTLTELTERKDEILSTYCAEWTKGRFLYYLADSIKEYDWGVDGMIASPLSRKDCRLLFEEAFDHYMADGDYPYLYREEDSRFRETLNEVLCNIESSVFDKAEKKALGQKNLPLLKILADEGLCHGYGDRGYHGYLISCLLLCSPKDLDPSPYLPDLIAHYREDPDGNGYGNGIFDLYRLLDRFNRGAELVDLALLHVAQLQKVDLEADFDHKRRFRLIKVYGHLLKGASLTRNYNFGWRIALPLSEELMLLRRYSGLYDVREEESGYVLSDLFYALPYLVERADSPEAYFCLCTLKNLFEAKPVPSEGHLKHCLRTVWVLQTRECYEESYAEELWQLVKAVAEKTSTSFVFKWNLLCLDAWMLLEKGRPAEAKKVLRRLKRLHGKLKDKVEGKPYGLAVGYYDALLERLK